MAKCSPHFKKNFVKSGEGVFKLMEIVVGAASWLLLCAGNVLRTSVMDRSTLFLTLVMLLVWFGTCASYVLFLFTPVTKKALAMDSVLTCAFFLLYAVSTAMCTVSDFIWVCTNHPYCGILVTHRNVWELRNGGENLAVVIFGAVLAGIYFTQFVYQCTKLCTKTFIPQIRIDQETETLNDM
ncbi:uncharacterized protein LOC143468977 [Clavelina lepadiformis]|uniref:uncharacterized protein LOC143468977 n=1 Tax=Clavelina lepadiformis TaxID=159417 RepID=UPI0040410B62